MAAKFLQTLRATVAGIYPAFLQTLGFGYAQGGTVTQATGKTTAFTLDKLTGRIIFASGALAAWVNSSAQWTNSYIGSYDVIGWIQNSGTRGAYNFAFDCSNGSATVWIWNNSSSSLNEAVAIEFVVWKGSQSTA